MTFDGLQGGPVIPVSDLARSREFYEGSLGFSGEPAPGGYRLQGSGGTVIYLLAGTDYAGQAEWPLISFGTDDLATVVDGLHSRGVTARQDVPYDTDERGIATVDGMRIAWICDPDDQVISIFELD
jgi:catechol 2,3-dioxygenase-like lactoylglutathione lyase family enzyme